MLLPFSSYPWRKKNHVFYYRAILEDLYYVGTRETLGSLGESSVGVLNALTPIFQEYMLIYLSIYHGLSNKWRFLPIKKRPTQNFEGPLCE